MILKDLQKIIYQRIENGKPDSSYVARLHSEGADKILKKISEEAVELILAGKDGKKAEIVHETADLWFHTLTLLSEKGIDVDDILKELERRFGASGIEEKKRRKK